MSEPTIICPTCKTEIKLTESLALPLIEATKTEYEQRIQRIQLDVAARESDLDAQQKTLEKQKDSLQEEIVRRTKIERSRIAEEEARKARLLVSSELDQQEKDLADLQQVLKERESKLGEAQRAQAELVRKQRELDDARREMELTIETRVQESLEVVRDQAKKDAEDQLRLKVVEKEQTIISMQRQIEELKQRAEQGSQQLQGEAQELELESILRAKFAQDTLEPVAKGEIGADLLHHVSKSTGQRCGTIVWEAKRTKHWSESWLSKIRNDQRAAKADVAVIVSKTLPKGLESFDLREGVWVVDPRCIIPIATVLRQGLIEVAGARKAAEGQQSKMELLYEYLTGPRFRQRVQAIVEKFSDMQEDLDRERKALTRLWAKREEQIREVIEATAGMYGDLQGIAGRSLHEVEGLGLKRLGSGDKKAPGA